MAAAKSLPPPSVEEMRVARERLRSLRLQHAPWRAALTVPVGRLVELHMARDGMWGVRFKGKNVLREYDTSTEAWAEANAAKGGGK